MRYPNRPGPVTAPTRSCGSQRHALRDGTEPCVGISAYNCSTMTNREGASRNFSAHDLRTDVSLTTRASTIWRTTPVALHAENEWGLKWGTPKRHDAPIS